MLAFTPGRVPTQPLHSAPSVVSVASAPVAAPSVEASSTPMSAAPASYATAPQAAVALSVTETVKVAAWDWLQIVADLKLGGMAKMLADHCELVSNVGDQVLLCVADEQKHLLDRGYQDKLIGALRERHGVTLQVKFEIGVAAAQTPQQVRTRKRDARQAEAVAAIESDPFIRELVEHFDAKVVESTIQPLGETQ